VILGNDLEERTENRLDCLTVPEKATKLLSDNGGRDHFAPGPTALPGRPEASVFNHRIQLGLVPPGRYVLAPLQGVYLQSR
jgi:hypothetical protein